MGRVERTFLEKRLMRWTMLTIYVAHINQSLCIVFHFQNPVKLVH